MVTSHKTHDASLPAVDESAGQQLRRVPRPRYPSHISDLDCRKLNP